MCKPKCPHLNGSVGALSVQDFEQLVSVRECDVCRLNIGKRKTNPQTANSVGATNLWLCLYPDCYMLGCSDDVQGSPDHSTKHQDNYSHHHIQLNITTRKVWCYGCVREITSDMASCLSSKILEVSSPTKTEVQTSQLSTSFSSEPNAYGKPINPKQDDAFVAKGASIDEQERIEMNNGRTSRNVGGLVGLSNLGNTCYMNAALQCLSNIPALSDFFITCPALVTVSTLQQVSENGRNKTGVSKAYMNHIKDIWTVQNEQSTQHPFYGNRYVAPSRLMLAFKNAYPMFRGFHQHDSQEFLRCFLDQLHEELAEPMLEDNGDMNYDYDTSLTRAFASDNNELDDVDLDSVSEFGDEYNTPEMRSLNGGELVPGDVQPMDEQEYETADSGVSEQSNSSESSSKPKSEITMDQEEEISNQQQTEINSRLQPSSSVIQNTSETSNVSTENKKRKYDGARIIESNEESSENGVCDDIKGPKGDISAGTSGIGSISTLNSDSPEISMHTSQITQPNKTTITYKDPTEQSDRNSSNNMDTNSTPRKDSIYSVSPSSQVMPSEGNIHPPLKLSPNNSINMNARGQLKSPSKHNKRQCRSSLSVSSSESYIGAPPHLSNNASLNGMEEQKPAPKRYRSIISDIFDGKLVSTVQCLTCERVSTTTETFQDLSLPIATDETVRSMSHANYDRFSALGQEATNSSKLNRSNSLNSSSSTDRLSETLLQQSQQHSLSNPQSEGWFSWAWNWIAGWFYGPNITLNDCLACFFSADELKGDNMYSCEKCKKLRNGLKFSRVTVLPDTLCIHLKRFRHDFAFSTKISSRVTFPLVDLDMSQWLHKDFLSQETRYDLSGVVCHHGTSGGGHYTAYALNPSNEEWYEFDDSSVTKVDAAAVLAAEAYVLFYRKNNSSNEMIRENMQALLRKDQTPDGQSASLVQYYVSRQWVNKLENFAEPGPIDNSDFLCRHGGVPPNKKEHVYNLVVALPRSVWELLFDQFGSIHCGPTSACTRLYECTTCRNEEIALTKQKTFELEEFKRLHAEFQSGNNSHGPSAVHCISSSWFKQWEAFVTDRSRDPPSQIDNRGIVMTVGGFGERRALKPSSDHFQVSSAIWGMWYSIYGGGPEVILRPNGSSVVIPTTYPIHPQAVHGEKLQQHQRSISESSFSSSQSKPASI